jgi:hypothetical protein
LLQVIYVLKQQGEVELESVDLLDWATLDGKPDMKIASPAKDPSAMRRARDNREPNHALHSYIARTELSGYC